MKIKTFVEGPIDANNYLIIDEKSNEAVLIDCSSARQEFVDEIKSNGVNLKYILLTHGHFDHLLGVDTFKQLFNVDTYVSEADMEQVNLVPNMMQMFLGMSAPKINSINRFVKDGDEFTIGDIKIKAISTPGHTQGGTSYLIGDKVFSGDTLFRASVGRTDLPGGDFKKLLHSVKEKLFTLPESVEVFPGHGEKSTIGYEKQYNEILNI
jgi:glyoxylase-like metal-dependent hydrolase (beta-lactamase superfamily II)